jgi:hypothetical protein
MAAATTDATATAHDRRIFLVVNKILHIKSLKILYAKRARVNLPHIGKRLMVDRCLVWSPFAHLGDGDPGLVKGNA